MEMWIRWIAFVAGFAVFVGWLLRLISRRQNSDRRRYEDAVDNAGSADSNSGGGL